MLYYGILIRSKHAFLANDVNNHKVQGQGLELQGQDLSFKSKGKNFDLKAKAQHH